MTDQPTSNPSFMTPRLERWLTALVILGTIAVAFLVIGFVTSLVAFFGDVIMIFFLAWLLAFILGPLANGLLHLFPGLPRALAVIIVYSVLIVVVVAALLLIAQQLYNSINTLVSNWPTNDPQRLHDILQPWQDRLNSLGLSQISLYDQTNIALDNIKTGASSLVGFGGPLSNVAFASIGVMGNLLFVFFLSLYMAVDRDHIMSFLFRLVPPAYTEEARLLEQSVSRSFGGFLRGQALMGLLYGIISMFASMVVGLPYMPVTAVSSGVLQAIPFFGPFISWVPPVAVAVFFQPDAIVPVLLIMVVGWFVLMNIVQPRLMSEAVGLHPVVVLGSVMVGTKLAGIPGAIFGIPIAAVIASFFFYYLGRNRETGSVALRAARRVEEREGRPVRVPRLPQAGEDQEVEQTDAGAARPAQRRIRFRPSFRQAGVPVAQARPMSPKAEVEIGGPGADPDPPRGTGDAREGGAVVGDAEGGGTAGGTRRKARAARGSAGAASTPPPDPTD